MNNLGIIGLGNMANAILSGIIKKNILPSKQIIGFDIDAKKTKEVRHKFKINSAETLDECVSKSDTLLLCVKPQQAKEVLSLIKPHLKKQKFVSIMAGLEVSFFKKHLSKKIEMIRVMPNTPSLILKGMSVLYVPQKTSSAFTKNVKTLFESLGSVEIVKSEKQMHAVTALSGSGPAFVFLFLKSLIQAGVELGLSKTIAKNLAIKTLQGASHLFEDSPLQADELIKQVTSKGGTTEAGLKILLNNNFSETVKKCVGSAKNRSVELGELLNQ